MRGLRVGLRSKAQVNGRDDKRLSFYKKIEIKLLLLCYLLGPLTKQVQQNMKFYDKCYG